MPTGASRLGFWWVTPFAPPPPPPEPPVDPQPIDFDADYIVIEYTFSNGRDLDTRSRVNDPAIPPPVGGQYVGWGQGFSQGSYPSGTVLTWGGDNTGQGVESTLLDLRVIKADIPAATNVVVECRCMWFGAVGSEPVYLTLLMYQGGTMVKSGFTWINPTATAAQTVYSVGKVITAYSRTATNNGELLGSIVYNVTDGQGDITIVPVP
jgi:hypothetical protein